MTCATTGTQVYAGSTAAAFGTFVTNDVRYVRLTNLDDTNFVVLHLEGNSHYSQIAVPAGGVFFLTDVAFLTIHPRLHRSVQKTSLELM